MEWNIKVYKPDKKKGKVIYQGTGKEIRYYVHVKDAAKLTLKAHNREMSEKSVSIFGDKPVTVDQLFDLLFEIFGKKKKVKYLKKTNSDDPVMLIYNRKLSVCPLTTHLPISKVSGKVKKKLIIDKVKKINVFYNKILKINPKIAVTGLNPHCESFDKDNKEKKEIIPAIKYLKKIRIDVEGPYSPDTIFLKENTKKFDVIVGMYHDQVLGPMKTLYGFKAINITIGLPFIRISPDHGPNIQMLGKNKSDPTSVFYAFNFLNKIK